MTTPNTPMQCTMGVGCDEAGVCYAAAHGAPRRCPKSEVVLIEVGAVKCCPLPPYRAIVPQRCEQCGKQGGGHHPACVFNLGAEGTDHGHP